MIDHIIDHQRCALWAEMGTGKTGSVLSAMDVMWMAGSNCTPALILGPKRVARSVWTREAAKWHDFKGIRVSPIIGTAAQRAAALRREAEVYTINYENIPWLLDQLGKSWPFRWVVADEASKLKGYRLKGGGVRAAALGRIMRKAGRWTNLTGTPAANGLEGLWGQTYFLDAGKRLGRTITEFRDRWFTEDPHTFTYRAKPFAQEAITEALSDICLTIRAKDWFDLREPIFTTVEVELPRKARQIYKDLANVMFAELKDGRVLDPQTAAALSMKCLQVASGLAMHTEDKSWQELHDEKLTALASIVQETDGEPLMVGYWWKADRERLLKRFPFARALDTKQDEDDWNEGRIPMLITHYASAGHGLDLQYGGHRIVHFSRWWDLEYDDQLRARLGPMRQFQAGFDRPVYEYSIVARDTVDELLIARHADKREVQDLLMEATG